MFAVNIWALYIRQATDWGNETLFSWVNWQNGCSCCLCRECFAERESLKPFGLVSQRTFTSKFWSSKNYVCQAWTTRSTNVELKLATLLLSSYSTVIFPDLAFRRRGGRPSPLVLCRESRLIPCLSPPSIQDDCFPSCDNQVHSSTYNSPIMFLSKIYSMLIA